MPYQYRSNFRRLVLATFCGATCLLACAAENQDAGRVPPTRSDAEGAEENPGGALRVSARAAEILDLYLAKAYPAQFGGVVVEVDRVVVLWVPGSSVEDLGKVLERVERENELRAAPDARSEEVYLPVELRETRTSYAMYEQVRGSLYTDERLEDLASRVRIVRFVYIDGYLEASVVGLTLKDRESVREVLGDAAKLIDYTGGDIVTGPLQTTP